MYRAIGLMSGTSLDGLDICYVQFQRKNHWSFEILQAETISYSSDWEKKLRNAVNCSAEELMALNSEYGFLLGKLTSTFIEKHGIEHLDVIASHGHTVFHQPDKKFTTQIGDGRAIKIATGFPVAYDFRMQDVLLGGNGAPLVPIGDELLFSDFAACINLGGFSNISFRQNEKRIAFDICPVNILLNRYAQKLGSKYDENGNIARQGNLYEKLLQNLNHLNYYQLEAPKSLGSEWVENSVEPLLIGIDAETVLATFTKHASDQISKIISEHNFKNVLVTGGGAYNRYLIELIEATTKTKISVPEKTIIEFKEALIFAFMGVLRIIGENNVLSNATGSRHDHCTGLLV